MIERVTVSSETTDRKYVVTFVADQPVACTCPNYNYRSAEVSNFSCKHMRKAQSALPLSAADRLRVRELLAQR